MGHVERAVCGQEAEGRIWWRGNDNSGAGELQVVAGAGQRLPVLRRPLGRQVLNDTGWIVVQPRSPIPHSDDKAEGEKETVKGQFLKRLAELTFYRATAQTI